MSEMNQNRLPVFQRADRVLPVLFFLCMLAVLFSLSAGSSGLSIADVFSGAMNAAQRNIWLHVRIPRTIACVAAGAALAAAGLLIQSVLANPLAAPNIIGIHSGAGFFTALVCALWPSIFNLVPAAAFAGSLFSAGLVLFLARRLRAGKTTIILAGLAISQIFSALTDLVITLVPDALSGYTGFRIGSLSAVSMEKLLPGLLIIIPALILSLICAPELEVLSLGSSQASVLGLNTRKWNAVFLFLASLLTGGAISFGGLIGFIGLIIPQIARRILGPATRRQEILFSILGGALFLLLADTLGRIVFMPYEIPCGILLSLAGGPYFLWLLIRSRKKSPGGSQISDKSRRRGRRYYGRG